MTTEDNQAPLKLNKNPTSDGEASQFSQVALDAENRRSLANKSAEQGFLGKWIGSSDSSLNTLFTMLLLAFIIILIIVVHSLFTEWDPSARDVIGWLASLLSIIIGYIMGKNSQN